jgi:hypothetical protein
MADADKQKPKVHPRPKTRKPKQPAVTKDIAAPEVKPPEVKMSGTNCEVISARKAEMGTPSLVLPTSPDDVLNNVIAKAALDPKIPPPEPPSVVNEHLKHALNAFITGESIEKAVPFLKLIATGVLEKVDIVKTLKLYSDLEAVQTYLTVRDRSLRAINNASTYGKISTSESIVLWRTVNEDLPKLMDSIDSNAKAVDINSTLEKADSARKVSDEESKKMWEGTTPQGREIIRKTLHKLQKQLDAQLAQAVPPEPPPDPPEDFEEDTAPAKIEVTPAHTT